PNPTSNDPATVWTLMTQRLLAADIPGAIPYFSGVSADKYRDAFLSIGTTDLTPVISQIGTITPVFIGGSDAQYRFDQVIQGITITFPINFVLEKDRKSTRLNSSHGSISYAVLCLKTKKI